MVNFFLPFSVTILRSHPLHSRLLPVTNSRLLRFSSFHYLFIWAVFISKHSSLHETINRVRRLVSTKAISALCLRLDMLFRGHRGINKRRVLSSEYWNERSVFIFNLIITESKCCSYIGALREHLKVATSTNAFSFISSFSDLRTVSDRLKSGHYPNKDVFIADMMRIFSNCRLYNLPESYVYRAAHTLERFFISKMREAELWNR